MKARLIVLVLVTALLCAAQDWQSLSQLHPGERVRLTLKDRTLRDAFSSFTPVDITVGRTTTKREDVIKLERYRHTGGRGRRAGYGALIGGGAGLVIGAVAGGCKPTSYGPCFSPGEVAGVLGAVGAIIGAAIGALVSHSPTDLIYAAK